MQPRSELVQRLEQPAIDVRQLRKTYPGGVEAVKGIDFQVVAGEVFGLLGPNGAGKSTTIGMLTTTIAPTSGRPTLPNENESFRMTDFLTFAGVEPQSRRQ
jgi:ABC-2 type transport system ATP-binding protein